MYNIIIIIIILIIAFVLAIIKINKLQKENQKLWYNNEWLSLRIRNYRTENARLHSLVIIREDTELKEKEVI